MQRTSALGISASCIAVGLAVFDCGRPTASHTGALGPPRRGNTARLGMQAPGMDVEPPTGVSVGGIRIGQSAAEYLAYPRPDFTLEPRQTAGWQSANWRWAEEDASERCTGAGLSAGSTPHS
jgi:hypothetical protein